jgi:hypothetical protein
MLRKRYGIVAAGAAGAMVWAGAPAQAAVIDQESQSPYSYSYENYCGYDTAAPDDDIVIVTEVDGLQTYKLKTTPSGRLFFQGHFEEHATYSNPDTGRSWSSTLKAYEHDVKVLDVDESTNTASVLTNRHDSLVVYDEAGAVATRTSNLSQLILTVDLGTLEVELDQFRKANGRAGSDFCGDAARFTVVSPG